MSADFSQLSKLQVSNDRTAKYTFYQIEGEPTLDVAPATEANGPYFNALLKRAKGTVRRMRAGGVNAGMLAENRNDDRDLYPKHIVRGWSSVRSSKGSSVEFSVENAKDFLEALPNWLFDELRTFCNDPANFVGEGELTPDDKVELQGN